MVADRLGMALEKSLLSMLVSHAPAIISSLPLSTLAIQALLAKHRSANATQREILTVCNDLANLFPCSFGFARESLRHYDPVVLQLWLDLPNDANTHTLQDKWHPSSSDTNPSPPLHHVNPLQVLVDALEYELFFQSKRNAIHHLTTDQTAFYRLFRQRLLDEPESQYTEICPSPNKQQCIMAGKTSCTAKIHFDRLVMNNTDNSLGDCSYLDTCYKGRGCKYVHYRIVYPSDVPGFTSAKAKTPSKKDRQAADSASNSKLRSPFENWYFTLGLPHSTPQTQVLDAALAKKEYPAQWINCDIRKLDLSVLGSFAVVIADPPWDIHMNTSNSSHSNSIADDELLNFEMQYLQPETGVFFLWVTGRAIDIGRKCLRKWGYDTIEEILWCKTNELGRTICTGRTGHWLNHSKEHVLMGIKGSPKWLVKGVEVDVLVSTTSGRGQKPDELYNIANRLAGPYSRKLELFGCQHNTRPGWLTIGDKVDGTVVYNPLLTSKLAACPDIMTSTG